MGEAARETAAQRKGKNLQKTNEEAKTGSREKYRN